MHDNPALHKACTSSEHVFPVFCLDPHFISSGTVGPNRIRFLLESLEDLDSSLRSAKSQLFVLHGNPTEVLPGVVKALGAELLCFENDTEPYAIERDRAVSDAISDVEVCSQPAQGLDRQSLAN